MRKPAQVVLAHLTHRSLIRWYYSAVGYSIFKEQSGLSTGKFSIEYVWDMHMTLGGHICSPLRTHLQALSYFAQLLYGNKKSLLGPIRRRANKQIICGDIKQWRHFHQKVNWANSGASFHTRYMIAIDTKSLSKFLLCNTERLPCTLQSFPKTIGIKWNIISIHICTSYLAILHF